MIIHSSHRLPDIPIRRGGRARPPRVAAEQAVARRARPANRASVPLGIDVDAEDIHPASLADSAQTATHIPAEATSGVASRGGSRAHRLSAYRAPHALAGTCAPRGIGPAPGIATQAAPPIVKRHAADREAPRRPRRFARTPRGRLSAHAITGGRTRRVPEPPTAHEQFMESEPTARFIE
ncbi:hypothetical protein GA845_04720 [Burkholderia pseudomallei]|nr:hypothetical protein [Burkholderia pseudomallei]